MRMRSELMIAIRQAVAEWGVTQTAALQLEVTQSRLDDLLRGRINNFSLDALTVRAAPAHAGADRTGGGVSMGCSLLAVTCAV